MAKQCKYFKNEEAVIRYYGSLDKIPSRDLVIVEDTGAMYARTNNIATESGHIGGSEVKPDPLYGSIVPQEMIEDKIEKADYVMSTISDNWSYDYTSEAGVTSYNVSWDEITTIDVEGESVDKIVRVEINGDPHDIVLNGANINTALEDYPGDLYDNICPILENATLTANEDPSEDGYDYLLVGDLYAWNLFDMAESVQEITEGGFYPNNGALGFDVNIVSEPVEPEPVEPDPNTDPEPGTDPNSGTDPEEPGQNTDPDPEPES